MDSWESFLSFLEANSSWLFGGAGLAGALIALFKLFLSKPNIQQSQTVNGDGEAIQAARDIIITKPQGQK